jgi:glycosyltransferase involved in cell wall biosynthesis
MQILRVAQKLYPEAKGGGAYHVHAMSRDQAAMGHDVTVLTVGGGPPQEEREGYTVIRRPARLTLAGNDIAPGVWRELRNAVRYDVVHAHSHLYFSTNLAALRRRLGGPPLAITNHGLYSQSASEQMFDVYLRTIGKWTIDSADVMFCYTDEEHERLRQLGLSARVEVVHNGIDTSLFTPEGPTSELVDDGPAVLFVGRLVEGKRPQDAVSAFANLPEELDATLYVCGTGPMRDALEGLATTEGVRDSVEFLGHVEYDGMPAVYRSADLLVLPSRTEGFPRTVLEAFASGVPVVSSRLEQIAPVVERAGVTVPLGDVEGYVAAIGQVLNQRDRLGVAARDLVVESFRWRDTVEATTSQLESIR